MRGILDHLGMKAVSLGLAVMLWFVIAGEKSSEMGLQVKVELQNFPKDLELTGEPVDTVEVRLRASPGIIQRLSAADVSAQVDVAGATEGESIVHLTPRTIRVPFGVKVIKINPSTLTLNFERTLQKLVPVRPRLLGRPAAGYEVERATSDPVEVRVAGPRTRVEDVESAFTEAVSVEGARGALTQEVNIGLQDPVLRIQGSPRVHVRVEVREERAQRVLERVPVAVRGGATLARPTPVTVTLTGPRSEIGALGREDVSAFVEPGPGDTSALVRVEVRPGHPGVTVEKVEPATLAVRAPRAEKRG